MGDAVAFRSADIFMGMTLAGDDSPQQGEDEHHLNEKYDLFPHKRRKLGVYAAGVQLVFPGLR